MSPLAQLHAAQDDVADYAATHLDAILADAWADAWDAINFTRAAAWNSAQDAQASDLRNVFVCYYAEFNCEINVSLDMEQAK